MELWLFTVACAVTTGCDTHVMTELIPKLASYGIPGLLLALMVVLVYKLIDRGFELKVPPPDNK
jgi:hypothetical protein